MGKTVLAEVGGFTPLIDSLVKAVGLVTAAVFGRAWRYCQMEDKVCKATLETIADGIGLDKATVMRHVGKLCELGYLIDLTPGLKNRPHVYADTGKASLSIRVDAGQDLGSVAESYSTMTQSNSGVAESNSTVAESHGSVAENNSGVAQSNVGVAESHLNKVLKKDIKKDSEEIEPATDFSNLSLEEARKCPTLSMFEQAAGFPPASNIRAFVDRYIREHNLTKESIHEAAEAWARRGYRRENVEGTLDWAANGIPPINSANRNNGNRPASDKLPKPRILCGEGARLKESAEQRGEIGRIAEYHDHLKTCTWCSGASNIEEIMRQLAERMKG